MSYWSAFKALSFNQKLTSCLTLASIVTGLGTLIISGLAFRLAANGHELENAVKALSKLATQGQRQAESLADQTDQMRSEVREQVSQTNSLNRQALSSEKQVEQLAAELRLSQSALRVQLKVQESQRRQLELFRKTQIQLYRNVATGVIGLETPEFPHVDLKALIAIGNFGTAPLRIVSVDVDYELINGDPQIYSSKNFARVANFKGTYNIDLAPNTVIQQEAPIQVQDITEQMVKDFKAGEAKVILLGRIVYVDPLGNKHFHNLCYFQAAGRLSQVCVSPPST